MAGNKSELLETINNFGFPGREVVLTFDAFFANNNHFSSI
jgi:hypothetical protein